MPRPSLRLLGWMLLGASALLATSAACSCDPPTAPSNPVCMQDSVPTVTAVRLVDIRGAELVDGSALPEERGAQGGSHVWLQLEMDGTGFGECVQVSIDIEGVGSYMDGARVSATPTGARTRALVFFGGGPGCHRTVATVHGVTRTVLLGTCTIPDGGPDTAAICGDGARQGGEECDDPDRALCTAGCTFEVCDGIEVAGETCFVPGPPVTTDPVLALASRAGVPGDEVVTAVRRPAGTFALERRSPTLELLGEVPLPFEPASILRADRDGDGTDDDLIVLSVDRTQIVEASGDATGLVLGTPIVLAAPLNDTGAITACAVDSAAGDELLVGVGPSILLADTGAVWAPEDGTPTALACDGSDVPEAVVAVLGDGSVYAHVPTLAGDVSVVPLGVSGMLGLANEPLLGAVGLSSSPILLTRSGSESVPWFVPSFTDIAAVARADHLVVGVTTTAGPVVTAQLRSEQLQSAGVSASRIEGLSTGDFVVADGDVLVLLTPSG